MVDPKSLQLKLIEAERRSREDEKAKVELKKELNLSEAERKTLRDELGDLGEGHHELMKERDALVQEVANWKREVGSCFLQDFE